MNRRCWLVVVLLAWVGAAAAETSAWAPKTWSLDTGVAASLGSYSGSQARRRSTHHHVHFGWQYLERSEINLRYGQSRIDFKRRFPSIVQDEWALSGQVHEFTDVLHGRVTLRVDGYLIDSEEGDDATALGGMAAYTNYARSVYADVGYVATRYGDAVSATADRLVDQFTLTAGLGTTPYWAQARAYLIYPAASLRADDSHDWLQALEAKGYRSLQRGGALKPRLLWLGVIVGERQYAVDPDNYEIYNLADYQTAFVEGGLRWTPISSVDVDLVAGSGRYHNHALDDGYSHLFTYFAISYRW